MGKRNDWKMMLLVGGMVLCGFPPAGYAEEIGLIQQENPAMIPVDNGGTSGEETVAFNMALSNALTGSTVSKPTSVTPPYVLPPVVLPPSTTTTVLEDGTVITEKPNQITTVYPDNTMEIINTTSYDNSVYIHYPDKTEVLIYTSGDTLYVTTTTQDGTETTETYPGLVVPPKP